MTASLADGKLCSAGDVRHAMSDLMPHMGPCWERPLEDYAATVFDAVKVQAACRVRLHAMELLCRCVERAARRSGFADEEARRASHQLASAPVLQTGPHCFLLPEPVALYTHLFSLMGLEAHGLEWYITYHASTVSFAEKAKKGPGWLWLEGEALNVFGLPRSRMDSFSVCGLSGPYRFALTNAQGQLAPNAAAAHLLCELPSGEFASAADAIGGANQMLWRRRLSSSVKLLQLDDLDIADLVADHLEDPASWLSAGFIRNRAVAESVLDTIDQLNTGPWKGWVRRTTDFFWGTDKGRIVPLRLRDNVLRTKNQADFEVQFRPESLVAALRQRVLAPNLFLVFLVTSIMPGVRVLGGCRQVIYYPLMRYLAAKAFARSGELEVWEEMRRDRLPGLWGHRVLKPDGTDPFGGIGLLDGAAALLSRYRKMPLVQAAGDLESFTRDPLWADLSANTARGTINSASTEWQWSGQ
ncbi:hypothetical protein [Ensifer sp. ENS09]|uniref:hypothetical protein n=1 Tax=Ensifer sp. ENS09 TaxID=2769263 RepID=UPI001FEEF041|nr:hypothetical protein [Ensifer sp. ENS09]